MIKQLCLFVNRLDRKYFAIIKILELYIRRFDIEYLLNQIFLSMIFLEYLFTNE